jgi:hypothetical protein
VTEENSGEKEKRKEYESRGKLNEVSGNKRRRRRRESTE